MSASSGARITADRGHDPLRFSDEALPGTRVAARIEYHGGGYHAGRRSRIWTWLLCKKHWRKRCHLLQAELPPPAPAGLIQAFTGIAAFTLMTAGRSIKASAPGTNRHLPDDVRGDWAHPWGRFPPVLVRQSDIATSSAIRRPSRGARWLGDVVLAYPEPRSDERLPPFAG